MADRLPVPAPVTAQSRQDTDPLDRDIVAVGAGLAVVPDYEGSDHYRPVVAPAAIGSVKGHSFVVAGNQASLNLLRDRPGRSGRYRWGRLPRSISIAAPWALFTILVYGRSEHLAWPSKWAAMSGFRRRGS